MDPFDVLQHLLCELILERVEVLKQLLLGRGTNQSGRHEGAGGDEGEGELSWSKAILRSDLAVLLNS